MRTFDRTLTDDKFLVQSSPKLAVFETTTTTVRDYKTLPLVLDVHDEVLNVLKLKGKIQAIRAKVGEFDDQPWNNGDSVAKYCNPYWTEYLTNSVEGEWDIDGYFFDNPQFSRGWNWGWPNDADPRIQILRRQIPLRGRRVPRFVWIDVERWWESYDAWYAFRHDPVNNPVPTRIPNSIINRSAMNLIERIQADQKAGKLPMFETGIYTSPGFVIEYCPDLDSSIQWHKQWIATYTYALEKILPTVKNADDLRARAIPTQGSQPRQLGNKMADSWQYGCNLVFADGAVTDRKTGNPCAVDVSIDLNPDTIISGGVIPPVIIPDPDPIPTTVYYAKVQPTAVGLKLRKARAIGMINASNIIDDDFRPIVKIKLAGKPVIEGNITWAEMIWNGEPAYFAVKQGTYPDYAIVTSETV